MRNADRSRKADWRAIALLPLLLLGGPIGAEAQTKAYVVHGAANLVTSIDTATGTVLGTVPVGIGPTKVAITRDGTRAYVANGGSDSISVIDTASDAVTGTIPVGDNPTALAVTPDGKFLYVMTAGGLVDVVDTALHTVAASIPLATTGDLSGDIAITPDGARAYVAAGLVHVIDTATNVVVSAFAPEQAPHAEVTNTAVSVAMSPDGRQAYVGVVTFYFFGGGFSAGGGVALVDTESESVTRTVDLGQLPGAIALTPDGSRAYVAIQNVWAVTGYGSAFFPGSHIVVLDTLTDEPAAIIHLGADGPNWTQQNTASGMSVTPDRGRLYAAIPRLSRVAVVDVNTNAVSTLIPVTTGPGHLAIVRNGAAVLVPYVVDAADDTGNTPGVGGTAVANVLANDRLGGILTDTAHVTLTQVSSTSAAVALDLVTGAVTVAPGTALGGQTLVYRICEIADGANCDEATVTVTVRAEYGIDAVGDSATTRPGRTALASVLTNDRLNGTPATGRVTLSVVSSTSPGVTLDLSNGSVFVAVGTAFGVQTLTYRICEMASPANCDTADAAITVNPYPIDAVNDAGWAPRTGGTAVANVLANDTFAGAVATLAKVRLTQVAASTAGVALNVASGAVTVAAGTPVGTHSVQYRICEIVGPPNCDEATVTVTVQHLQIYAAADSARGSSKVASTILPSVLTNDRLGNAPATTANVRLALVSLTPANSKIRLDLADGSVDVLGKTDSGLYTLVYEICELAMPANCGRGTVRIDLSGR